MTQNHSTTTTTIGEKFNATSAMDVAQIAKLVRADIKTAGLGPKCGLTIRVNIARYSMGRSITIVVCPTDEQRAAWINRTWLDAYLADTDYARHNRMTPAALAIEAKLEAILASYNRTVSDMHTDLHHARFHPEVRFDLNINEAMKARLAELKTAARKES